MALCGAATIVLVALVLVSWALRSAVSGSASGCFALSPIALGPISLNTYDAWPAAADACCAVRCCCAAGAARLRAARARGEREGLPARARAAGGWFVWRRAGTADPARARRAGRWSRLRLVAPFAGLAPHGVWESFHAQAARGAADREPRRGSFLLVLDRLGLYDARVVEHDGRRRARPRGGSCRRSWPCCCSRSQAVAVVAVVGALLRGHATCERLAARVRRRGRRLPRLHQRFFSPQYLVWLLPLVARCRACGRDCAGRRGRSCSRRCGSSTTARSSRSSGRVVARCSSATWSCSRSTCWLPRSRGGRSRMPSSLEDEPPLGVASQPGELDGRRQRRERSA